MKRALIIAALLLGAFIASPSAQSKFWVLVNGALKYNGPIAVANGTNAAPTYSFISNPTTGFYWGGSGTVIFAGNGVRPIQLAGNLTVAADGALQFSNTAGNATATADTAISRVAAGEFGYTAVAFASLGTPANGTFCYCSDCTIANPCASGGTGAYAKRLNGVWVCN